MKYALSPASLTQDRAPLPSTQDTREGAPRPSSPRGALRPREVNEQPPHSCPVVEVGRPPRRAACKASGNVWAGRTGICRATAGAPSASRLPEPRPACPERVIPGARGGSQMCARLPEAARRQPRQGTRTPNSGGGGTIGAREERKPAEPEQAPRERGRARGWSACRGPPGAPPPCLPGSHCDPPAPAALLVVCELVRPGARAAPRESPSGGGKGPGPPRAPAALGPRLRGLRVVPASGRGSGRGQGSRGGAPGGNRREPAAGVVLLRGGVAGRGGA